MPTQLRGFVVCFMFAGFVSANASDNLQQILARMDKAAGSFESMTAQVTYVTHTQVLNEDDRQSGSVIMKKVQAGEVQGKVDFTAPDRRVVTIQKHRLQEYLPKINTLQIYDLAKHGEQLDKLILIGFGTSGSELAKDYDVTVAGTENGEIRLELTPKSPDARQYVQKLDLWIPAQGDPYPAREKVFEPSGDYFRVEYTDLKINPPLEPDALELKVRPGVKTEYPGK
jgi:outer membrane lipoprotein-sorting protein